MGYSYEDYIIASGGTAPYEWVYDGELPPGLTGYVSGTNDQYVTLEGTPSTAGTYAFEILVIDANNEYKTKNFSITVTDPGTLSENEHATIVEKYNNGIQTNLTNKNNAITKQDENGNVVENSDDRNSNKDSDALTKQDLAEAINNLTHVKHDVSVGAGCDSGLGLLGLMIVGVALLSKRSK